MLSWAQIFRMGLVQMCLGAIVVLMTSTLNRLMVVELALPALLPGFLVGLHYAIQITRPNWGYRSDTGGSRTRWIVGGMAVLASGALLATLGVAILDGQFWLGLGVSILAYALIGVGVGASGTSLLALLASATDPRRRAAAATITWLMMIFGIALTAGVSGQFLDPYSPPRLLAVVGVVCSGAVALTAVAIWGIEKRLTLLPTSEVVRPFREGLAEVWSEPAARAFTIFIFLSMTAYFMQELILEPYAGLVFGFTPGQTTSLSGAQNGGVFLGMLSVGIAATGLRLGSLRNWVVAGCLGSAFALVVIATLGQMDRQMLVPAVVMLGVFNGMFAVAAIGSMMALAGQGRQSREGTRMGLWGASQAIAAGFGGLAGALFVDIARRFWQDAEAFGAVFVFEAGLFLVAAVLAYQILDAKRSAASSALMPGE